MVKNINDSVIDNLKVKPKKIYTQEFRDQVIGVYKSGVYGSVAACAKAYNICETTLSGWLRKYDRRSSPDFVSEQQAELARLKKELARAEMENEILVRHDVAC